MVDQFADSCFVKLSNCGSASEQEIKSFFQGIDIEVSSNPVSKLYGVCRLVELMTRDQYSSSAQVSREPRQLWPLTKRS